MPWTRYDLQGLASISDAARQVKADIKTFWGWTRRKIVPTPQTKVGNRRFYSEPEMEEVVRRVERFRSR